MNLLVFPAINAVCDGGIEIELCIFDPPTTLAAVSIRTGNQAIESIIDFSQP
jgi:hypothetical protein